MSQDGIYVVFDGDPIVDRLLELTLEKFNAQVVEFIEKAGLFTIYPGMADEIANGVIRLFFANSILPKIPEEAFESDCVDHEESLNQTLNSWIEVITKEEVTKIILESFYVYGLRAIDIVTDMLYNKCIASEANEAFDLAEQSEREEVILGE